MKIIYMGTGSFAVEPLSALLDGPHEVVAVFTAPPRLAKKSTQVVKNILHEFADSRGLNVYTPVSLSTESAFSFIDAIQADIIVVASYGQILSKRILDSKPLGAINIHPSALPRFRGASPLQHIILSGDKESAVCIIKMDEGVDTGPILLCSNFKVAEGVYYHQLESHCAKIGANLLNKVLSNFHSLVPIPQNESKIPTSYAKMIKKSDGLINWSKSAEEIERMVRAFAGWPGSFFLYNGESVKIFKAEWKEDEVRPFGMVVDSRLGIACGVGILRPIILQRAGKKAIFVDEFLRGFPIAAGEMLS